MAGELQAKTEQLRLERDQFEAQLAAEKQSVKEAKELARSPPISPSPHPHLAPKLAPTPPSPRADLPSCRPHRRPSA